MLFLLQGQHYPFGADTPPKPKDMIVIDGAVEPQLIPQWEVWSGAFRTLTNIAKASREGGQPPDGLPTSVHMSATLAERTLIHQTAVEHMKTAEAERDESRARFQKQILDAIKVCKQEEGAIKQAACRKVTFGAIYAENQTAEMKYRQDTLDRRNALREKLEANQVLVAALWVWVESTKRGIKLHISRKELAAYQKPE
jgi:hypothetical protein